MNSYILQALLLCSLFSNFVQPRKIDGRERRSVISLPSDSALYVTTDLIIPVLPLLNTTLTYLLFNFPLTFDVPTANNLNQLYASLGLAPSAGKDDDDGRSSNVKLDHNMIEEKRANHDRRQVYKYLEGFLQNFGLDGPACLQRVICELAEAPLGSHGLLGKVFELFFSPTLVGHKSGSVHGAEANSMHILPEELHFIHNTFEDDYSQAYQDGKHGPGCRAYTKSCMFSFLKMLDL